MKKTFLMLSVALLAMTSMSFNNTYAADDFDALLNALNDNTAEAPAATWTETPVAEAPVVETTTTWGEMDLDTMYASETATWTETPVVTSTEPLVEPTNTWAESTGFLDNVLGANTMSNEANVSWTPSVTPELEPTTETPVVDQWNTAWTDEFSWVSKLTATWLEDFIYVIALLSIIGWVALYRRKKSV